MSDTGRIELERMVKRKREEILTLERTLAEEKKFLQGVEASLKCITKTSTGAVIKVREGSDIAKAQAALRAAKTPLHIIEILKYIDKEPTKSNRASLGGSLGSYASSGKIFKKTGPNVYSLLEFDNESESTESDENKIQIL